MKKADYHIEKNSIQEALIIPLFGRLICSEHYPELFSDPSANMDYVPYPDGSGYEARFTKCGICTLMKELDLFELTPAMCRLDYSMSEAGGASEFVRQYTLASGGPYCDCGYKKKQ